MSGFLTFVFVLVLCAMLGPEGFCIVVEPSSNAEVWVPVKVIEPVDSSAVADPTWPSDVEEPDPRIDAIIARLEGESLDDSLLNLSLGDDYEFPGFKNSGPGRYVFEDRTVIFSNRRFAKIYEGLRALDSEAQYTLLKTYLDHYLAQLSDIIAPFQLSVPPAERPENHEVFGRMTEVEGRPPTLYGTRHAMEAIALLSGMLGNTRMWPELRQAFECPLYGMPLDETAYDEMTVEHFKDLPVYPPSIQADTILLMSMNAKRGEAIEAGFNFDRVRRTVPHRYILDVALVNYRSRVTRQELIAPAGGWPMDLSHGAFRIRILYDAKGIEGRFSSIIKAAAYEAAPGASR